MKACIRIPAFGLLLALSACATFGMTIPDAKKLADDQPITLNGKVVTCAGAGFFYIEEDSRSMGIRVETSEHSLTVGMRADVSGDMKTNGSNHERYIQAAGAVQSGPLDPNDAIKPLGMNNKALGLINIGLLVRTWGQFHQIDATTFTLDDGSGRSIRCTQRNLSVFDLAVRGCHRNMFHVRCRQSIRASAVGARYRRDQAGRGSLHSWYALRRGESPCEPQLRVLNHGLDVQPGASGRV
jgi:hypothetical protein